MVMFQDRAIVRDRQSLKENFFKMWSKMLDWRYTDW